MHARTLLPARHFQNGGHTVKRTKKLTLILEPFEGKGTGWYVHLNGRCVSVLMPSDLQKLVGLLGSAEGKAYANAVINEHYREVTQ